MENRVVTLERIGCDDTNIAGGKAANLGELIRNGFPVPMGFVVLARACEDFFLQIGITQDCKELNLCSNKEVYLRCDAIRDRIRNTELPSDLCQDIWNMHDTLIHDCQNEPVWAVRSSATMEDSPDASFAGQHGTYYYVNRDQLPDMVRHCWASLWNPEAVFYRRSLGIAQESVFMAVVIQKMVFSDVSGIAFTANPVSGDSEQMIIESSWGLGAAIVDGRVTPDRFVVDRATWTIRNKHIGEKRYMIPPVLDRSGTSRIKEVPYIMRMKASLVPSQVQQIVNWAEKAEELFERPQDVEWAMTNGQLYILQSRPLTTIRDETPDVFDSKRVSGTWVLFKPLFENFTEPLTPLSADLLGLEAPPGVRIIGGRVYLNLAYARPLIPFQLSDAQLATLLYTGICPEKLRLSMKRLPITLALGFLGYLLFGLFFARTRRLPDDALETYGDLCRQVAESKTYGIRETLSRLWAWSWMRFFDPIGYMPVIINLTSVRYMLALNWLKRLMKRWLPDMPSGSELVLCAGNSGILSARMGQQIRDLANEIRQNDILYGIFKNNLPGTILPRLKTEPQARSFLTHLDQFLDRFGHRGIREMELRSSRWIEDPAPVMGMIRNHVLAGEKTNRLDRQSPQTDPTRLIEQIRQRLRAFPTEKLFQWRWRIIAKLVRHIRYFSKLRENSRHYHVMGLYHVRKKILQVEEALIQQGKLRCKDDIFFLKYEEIQKLQNGQLDWFDVESRIRKRRFAHIRLTKTRPPLSLGTTMEQTEEIRFREREKHILVIKGTPASPGTFEGTARVILDPCQDSELQPGDVLIAPYTDPGWTPLFLTAGAAVVEVGSYLSHAGTVAREFGMPCVVDVRDCINRIETGMKVRVDGQTGHVYVISDEETRP